MWTAAFAFAKRPGLVYPRLDERVVHAAGNNLQLEISVAISVSGVTSGPAPA